MNNTDIYGNIGNIAGNLLGTGAQMYGQQNAGEAISKADLAAINTQQQNLGNINALYNPYLTGGAGAEGALGSVLGTNGKPADYTNFLNMPGYQFAVQQGTQAIQRQAAAMGSAYTPNTAEAVGQYVTGTAMQDYNTYVQQLQAQAGLGAQETNSLGNITYGVGNNISQLQQNTGMAQAGMYTGMGQSVGGALNGSKPGVAGSLAGSVGSLIGTGLRSLFGGGGGGGGGGGTNPDGTPNGGAPGMTYDPSSGGYYDPSTNTYYMPNDSGTGYDSYDGGGGD